MVGIEIYRESKKKSELVDTVLTIDEFSQAIKNAIGRQDINTEAAYTLAAHVMNHFGFNDYIIDNHLEPEDRDVFYMLEDLGLLATEREETTTYDGREWRIHYWTFRKDRILELTGIPEVKKYDSDSDIYEDIPDDIWSMSR